MPNCCCVSFGCGKKGSIDPTTKCPLGVLVDVRTFKSHTLQDRAAIAREASQRVGSAQEADIVQYISSMTLADKVSGATNHPGGRLWSRSDPDPKDLQTMMEGLSLDSPQPSTPTFSPPANPCNQRPPTSSTSEPSRQSRVNSHIRHLAGIEASVTELAKKTQKGLTDLVTHSGDPSAPFPLMPLLAACSDLRTQLGEVKSKQPAVAEIRRSIAEQLDDTQQLLDKAKRSWKQKCTEYGTAATAAAQNELQTGESIFQRRISYPNRVLRPSLPSFSSGRGPYTPGLAFHGSRLSYRS